MRNYIQRGEHITVAAAPRALESGEGCQVGDALFGAASGPAESGAEVVLATEGVFSLSKVTGTAFDLGAVLYWDNAAFNLTTDDEDNLAVGICVEAAGSSATTAKVKLGAPPAIVTGA